MANEAYERDPNIKSEDIEISDPDSDIEDVLDDGEFQTSHNQADFDIGL